MKFLAMACIFSGAATSIAVLALIDGVPIKRQDVIGWGTLWGVSTGFSALLLFGIARQSPERRVLSSSKEAYFVLSAISFIVGLAGGAYLYFT